MLERRPEEPRALVSVQRGRLRSQTIPLLLHFSKLFITARSTHVAWGMWVNAAGGVEQAGVMGVLARKDLI